MVPARELSLEEMKLLKQEGLEIETFIHGAMCYSYSGQCFFSSVLGGRSGNRGKCAQSCRLPYKVTLDGKKEEKSKKGKGTKEEYPLSLKDMCSIDLIPQLIEAGIDSFKIEGRMKRPEYAAGVTAIYRKYIDQAYKNKLKYISIEPEDREILTSLYIRSELQDGYYHRHNGKEMVTLEKPSYSGMKEEVAQKIYDAYIKRSKKAGISGSVFLKKGSPAILQLEFKNHYITVEEGMVEEAAKRPMEKSEIEKQLKKTGNTDFEFLRLEIDMDDAIFLPIKTLNELRRKALEQLESELKQEIFNLRKESLRNRKISKEVIRKNTSAKIEKKLFLSVDSKEQCELALSYSGLGRLYVAGELILEEERIRERLKEKAREYEIWIKFPLILRKDSFPYIAELLKLTDSFASGVLISNLESYGYLKYHNYRGKIALNHHVYLWNKKAIEFWSFQADSYLAPMECNIHEWRRLSNPDFEYYCYGKIPMMVTANCIRLTKDSCRGYGVSFEDQITDRYDTSFRVQTNCHHCYNVIYNSVPLSLHQYMGQIKELEGKGIRLEFTTETAKEMKPVMEQYVEFMKGNEMDFSFLKDYTTGHFKKGAL